MARRLSRHGTLHTYPHGARTLSENPATYLLSLLRLNFAVNYSSNNNFTVVHFFQFAGLDLKEGAAYIPPHLRNKTSSFSESTSGQNHQSSNFENDNGAGAGAGVEADPAAGGQSNKNFN